MRLGWVVVMVGVLMMGAGGRAVAEESTGVVVAGALDRKVFSGEVGGKGNAHGDKDEFQFHEGKFHSTACDPYGFGEGAYTTVVEGAAVTFEAETTSPTDGRMVWKGAVRGDTIEGTTTWYKKAGKTPDEMWFKGTLGPNG